MQLRCSQLWDKNFKDNDVDVVGSLNRNKFLKQYKLVLDELKSKTLNKSTEDIDRALFKKAMDMVKFGIDVSDFDDITLASGCVTVGVEFAKGFKDAEKLEVIVSGVSTEIEEVIVEAFQKQVNKSLLLMETTDEDYIPLFDLVLKARDRTEISKPYSNFHAARVKDPGAFARIEVIQTLPNGVMIYGGPLKSKPGGSSQAQAYRFPKGKFTAAEAKGWLKNHDIKTIMFEPAKKKAVKAKKLLEDTEEDKTFEKDIRIFPIDKADKDEHIVCGIVYEPDTVDAQGDKADETEIRKAAYQFMEDVQKIRVNHQGKPIKARVLESYIAPQDLTIAKQAIKKGTWVMTTRVLDAKVWKSIKAGELTGYSMAGYARAS